jgi:methionine-rich copper-binding protein CopC/putative copper export protein
MRRTNFKVHTMGWVAVVAALAVPALLPATAVAHPALLQSSPAPGLIAPSAVPDVELSLSESAVLDGSRITVSKLGGARIPTGNLQSSDGDKTLAVRPSQPLAEGTYEVHWSTLGDDGHQVSGSFAFGVAGKNGEVPSGAQAVAAFGSRGGTGSSSSSSGVFDAIGRWLAVLTAAFMLGGFVLVERLRRKLPVAQAKAATERWRLLLPIAPLFLVMAASEEALSESSAGVGSGFDPGLLFSSTTGVGIVLQLVISIAALASVVVLRRQESRRDLALAGAGLGVLVMQAITGHVQTLGSGIAFGAFTQILHVSAAGIWLGGLLTLLLVCAGSTKVPFGPAARAFGPIAAISLGVAVVTGVIAAVREIDHWYFLRWSGYGNVVLIKALLVLAVAGIAALLARRAQRSGASGQGGRLARYEALGVVAILGLAVALTALVPGRGQLLPAQRGNLLPGAALASAVAPGGPVRVTLAPARTGQNELSVLQEPAPGDTAPPVPRSVAAKLFCSCSSRTVNATLHPTEGGTWASSVNLADDGPWYARVSLSGRAASPVALPVGVPQARGPKPLEVLAIGDYSGEEADRCRSHLLGLQLGVGRINALGGLDGGRKVAVLALDDGGSPARAEQLARQADDADHPMALAAPCGTAAGGAVRQASADGVPAIVADPAVPLEPGDRIFRLAGDPYAEGYADGQYLTSVVAPTAASNVVRVVMPTDDQGRRRLDGLRAAIQDSKFRIQEIPSDALERGPAELRSVIDRNSAAAVMVDGNADRLAATFGGLGEGALNFDPAVLIAPSQLLSERLLESSGALGRTQAIQGAVEVTPDSATAQSYARAVPAVYPGESPSLDGLRGYVAGLALTEGVSNGTDPSQIAATLRQPAPFTDALLAPWRSDVPDAGNQRFTMVDANFLPATLIPTQVGGESFNGTFFTDGSWTRLSSQALGPPLQQPVPALAATGGTSSARGVG